MTLGMHEAGCFGLGFNLVNGWVDAAGAFFLLLHTMPLNEPFIRQVI